MHPSPQEEITDAVFNHKTITPPPPVTAAISYLIKIVSQASKGNSLFFPFWSPPAAAGLWKGLGWAAQHLKGREIYPLLGYLGHLRTEQWKPMVPSALLLAPGENRTQDMLPAWGRLAVAGREAMTFSLKEVYVMKGGRVGCYRLHLVLKLPCGSTSACFLPQCSKLIFTYIGMTLKTVSSISATTLLL